MFGFMNINMRNFGKNNTAIIHQAVDKMNKGNLEVSDILDSEELITDIKSSMSQLGQFFNEGHNIKSLIDYIIREPREDEHKKGHKFPFNACEVLCSDNPAIVSKMFDEHKVEDDDYDYDDKKPTQKQEDENFEIDIDIRPNDEIQSESKEIEITDNHYVVENIIDVNFKNADEAQNVVKEEEDIVNISEKIEIEAQNEQEISPFEKKTIDAEVNQLAQEINDNLEITQKEEPKVEKEEVEIETINQSPEDEDIPELIVAEDNKAEETKPEQKEDKKNSLNITYEAKLDTELLDYFFAFLDSADCENYVLSGYFAKVFGHFLNLRQSTLMRYLLVQKPQFLKSFTKHINKKSIMECAYKILISYAEDIPNSLNIKIDFLRALLDAFDYNDIDSTCNISDLLIELFSVRKMYFIFISNQEVFQMIHNFVVSNINNSSFVYLIRILQKANENILKDFGQSIVTPVFTCYETQEMFFNFTHNVNNLVTGNTTYNSQADTHDDPNSNIQNLYQQFNSIFVTLTNTTQAILANFVEESRKDDEAMDTTYGISNRKLGMRRLHEIEYLRSIFDILVNACGNNILVGNLDLSLIIERIVQTEFFKVAIVSTILFY